MPRHRSRGRTSNSLTTHTPRATETTEEDRRSHPARACAGQFELGATLGATRENNLVRVRTRMDNQERRARGHEPIRTGPDANAGIYGSALDTAAWRRTSGTKGG